MAEKEKVIAALGEPAWQERGDKVTICWYIKTPRGIVALRDYWWNTKNEWSIGTTNRKACLWAMNYLRSFGFEAFSGHKKRFV